MVTKFALAAAVGIAFPALAYFGFDTANPENGQGLTALVVIYAWVPVVLKCGAIALVWGHPMTARRQRIVRRRLEALAQRR
jgi:Na+/melibiose symporter-like transporter